MTYVLDTHVLIWWLLGVDRLSPAQQRVVDGSSSSAPVHVSDMTLWEIATLVSLGRLAFDLPLRDWLERAVAPPRVCLHRITPAVAAEVAALPQSFHRDPADRTIVGTARALGATLLTSDRLIIDARLVPTVA